MRWVGELVGFPAPRRRLHQRWHRVERDRPCRRSRARAARLAPRRLRRLPVALYCSSEAHYSVIRAAELLGIGTATRPRASDRRAAAGCGRGVAPRLTAIARPGWYARRRRGDARGQRSRARSTRSTRSPTSVPNVECGCTSTGPTACRRRRSPRTQGCSPASTARTPPPWMRTSGCTCPRPAASCSCAASDLAAALAHERGLLPARADEPNAVDITLEYRAVPGTQALARVPRRTVRRHSVPRSRVTSGRRSCCTARSRRGRSSSRSAARRPSRSSPSATSVRRGRCPEHAQRRRSCAGAAGRRPRCGVAPAARVDGRTCLRPCIVNFRTSRRRRARARRLGLRAGGGPRDLGRPRAGTGRGRRRAV